MTIKLTCIFIFFQCIGQLCFSQPESNGSIQNGRSIQSNKHLFEYKNKPKFYPLPPEFEYNEVRAILKDHKGYMWFGTTYGLIRYDGINLNVYESDPETKNGLSHKSINAIVEDKNNNLWIGTSGGLNRYDREKDIFTGAYNVKGNANYLNNAFISSLCVYNGTVLLAGTYTDGFNVYDPVNESIENYSYNPHDSNSISSNHITSIAVDMSNNIWVGTDNGLNLFIYKKGFKRFYNEPYNNNSLSNNHVTAIVVESNGNVWVGTQGGGLNKINIDKNNFIVKRFSANSKEGRISNNYILSLLADKNGNIWIGTDNGGLNRLNTKTGLADIYQTEEGIEYSIKSNSIWSLYEDNENRLWIGTYNRGIEVIDDNFKKFELYQRINFSDVSLTNNDVKGFTEDKQGNVWIATNGGGICKYNPFIGQFTRFVLNKNNQTQITNNAVQDILYDSRDNLWIGTWAGGIDRLTKDGNKIRNYKLTNNLGLENNNIFTLYEDRHGNIWACTAGNGLFLYDIKADKFFAVSCINESVSLTNLSYVSDIIEDSENNLWVGTLYGLVVIKKHERFNLDCINFLSNESTGLSSNLIETVFEDSKGRIWIGTLDKGLNLFNKKNNTFTVFQKKDGLPGNSIKGILEDDEGYLWISTNSGMCRFNFEKKSFTNYYKEDGLNSNEFNTRSCLRTKAGEFYFGGENGFNVFSPNNIKKNLNIPPVCLTSLKINNKPALIGVKGSPLKKHISETDKIILNYTQRSFSIEFIALNYTSPTKNQYCYKLEGFDKDWHCNGTQRSANYTNIMPGKYVFMVKGSNNDGVWNEIPTRLLIIIKPPVWKTWWAIITYVILISLIVYFFMNTWLERIKIKNQLKLEQLSRIKEHELNEKNIQFFTDISHEFRTPLSLIIAPLESLISSTQEKIKEQLMVIHRNAVRLLHLTNNLMDIRKLEEGITKLKVQHGDIIDFVKDISSLFNVNFKSKNINFSIETRETNLSGWFDPEKLETILLNLLSNAYKFTPENGKIRIVLNVYTSEEIIRRHGKFNDDIKPGCHYIEIRVIDNGLGIKADDLPYIFNKFYQVKSSGHNKKTGTGIGLTLTKGLIEIHHGNIWAESIPGKETCFTVVFPFDFDAYFEEETSSEPIGITKNIILNTEQQVILNKSTEEPENNEEKPDVLIVEDNDELRIFLSKELSKKFNVLEAEDGKIGIDLAFSAIPDLIVSDILMPQQSGIDLCKTIKSDFRTCHIPVILLTAKTTIGDQIEGIETGADAYITKPFNLQYLITQINQLIQSRRKLYAQFSQDVYLLPNKMANTEMDQQFLQKVVDFIILNITDNTLSVEDIADHLNISRSNVYRKIKALTGKTIIEFIRIIRLKQAIKLMETKKYSLAEIAYQTGFTSPSYFTKSFKDEYGKPPSEYLSNNPA
jgi:ligand-binding sensor domain-containing protein/signal transduction histidine kinase/DNA-binding response OmpR family regulator